MSTRRPLAWLLVLALLAGQWLLTAHDARHLQPVDGKAHLCQLCVHHSAQDLLAGGAAPLALETPTVVAPIAAAASVPRARLNRHYRARAPPLLA